MSAEINPRAESHPCMKCECGGIWTEMGNPAGNFCKHPLITSQRGRMLGRYHSNLTTPKWCPKGQEGRA